MFLMLRTVRGLDLRDRQGKKRQRPKAKVQSPKN